MSVATPLPSADRLNGSAPTVTLGGKQYLVIPQPVGRLKRRLGREMADLQSLQADSLEDFITSGLGRAHAILKVFLPELMPYHEFEGFSSQERFDSGDDEDVAGPTIPEIVGAFEAVMKVNRLDLLGHLKSVISPELIRAVLTRQLADWAASGQTTTSLSTSSTPGPDTPSTTSGAKSPTS